MTINQTKGFASLIGALAYIAGLAAVATLIWILWNILVPAITGWTHISWIQALGIRVLASLCSLSIRTAAEFDHEPGKDSATGSNESAGSPFYGRGERTVTARSDDDGGYTIKIDFTGSGSDEGDEEDE